MMPRELDASMVMAMKFSKYRRRNFIKKNLKKFLKRIMIYIIGLKFNIFKCTNLIP